MVKVSNSKTLKSSSAVHRAKVVPAAPSLSNIEKRRAKCKINTTTMTTCRRKRMRFRVKPTN